MPANGPDWTLPGMEKFDARQIEVLKRSIEDGTIVNSIHCLGWALWPTENKGYYSEDWLRTIADFLEIQNKPFWDAYDRHCEEQMATEGGPCPNDIPPEWLVDLK